MLLRHLNLHQEATRIEEAVEKSLELGFSTSDINPENPFGTSKVGDFIADYILSPEDTRNFNTCLLYTSPSPRDATLSRMPSSA